MDNELKLLLKEGGGYLFKSWDVPTSHRVSPALFMYAGVILQCDVLVHAITASGVCLHLLVLPLAQYHFFDASYLT